MYQITPLTTPFSVCKVKEIPTEWLSKPFTFIAHTDQETSLVTPTYCAPTAYTEREDGFRAFRIEGTLDFSLIGILANITSILAEHQIAVFAMSTYNTDYVMIKAQCFEQALILLKTHDYELLPPVSAIELIPAYDHLEDLSEIIKEYTDTIIEQGGEIVRKTLEGQHLEDELRHLTKKYGYPSGRSYLVLVDGQVAGSGALTKNDNIHAELKRLYIRPAYRGHHLSRLLIEQIIQDAKDIGYGALRLDTFTYMTSAIRLYESFGFRKTERYNDNPSPYAYFMQKEL